MRKQSGAIVCPSCNRLVEVREPRCPYCHAYRPGLWGFGPALRRLVGERLDLRVALLGALVALYGASLVVDVQGIEMGGSLFSLLGPSSRALRLLGMTGWPNWHQGDWWTLVTYLYLHGGVMHIAFNGMWIRDLAPRCEESFGRSRFFVIFTLSGIGAGLVSNLITGSPTIGASGSVFGLIGALVAWGRRRGGDYGRSLSREMWGYALIGFVLGFAMAGVNNYAHAGGFVTGFWLGWFQPVAHRTSERRWVHGLALALGVLTVASFGFAIASGWQEFLGPGPR